jgi:amino acid adenylation domain-containing protein
MTSFASSEDLAILDEWNSKTGEYPEDLCLQDLFWEQAAKTPNAIALQDGDKSMTYAELNDCTDRLASILFYKYNVRPDSVVAIFMERSAEYVIAYIAALKAGGAYMPVELVYPHGMIDRALTQTECSIVLTKSKHTNRLPDNFATFCLDSASSVPEIGTEHVVKVPSGGFTPRPNPDNLAFVVMSSGTTGTPKGICQVHRSAVHSYVDRFERYPYHIDKTTNTVSDRVGAGVFFVWECARPLLRGATCVVIPDDVLFDPEAVTNFIKDQNVTRVLFTPSLLQLIMDSLSPEQVAGRLGHVRMVWLCGEVVTVDLATNFGKLTPNTELLNLYSISECHDATIGNLKTELDTSQKYATCGKNIPNVKIYIVDFEDEERKIMKRVPINMPGEVFVGGPVLARGYLKMPKKTAERFVDNPFGTGKLYRTGDMGRMLKDGTLEIVGRCDFMVKIRGYSVVLGAVETALAKHPRLASAVVLALGAEGTDKRLVAWVVPKDWKHPPSAAHVRNFLKDHLPPYAIPGTFCVINALPVNQSAAGKLDRKHQIFQNPDDIPKLEAFNDDDNDEFRRTEPTNDVEKQLLAMFAELLSTSEDELSTGDDFFDIGGHSLLATRLLSKVNEHWFSENKQFQLKDVLGLPTIIGIGLKIQSKLDCGSSSNNEGEEKNDVAINLDAEANMLDQSIYPAATRKGKTLTRYRRSKALMKPATMFLTGATGYLGVHILSELISSTKCDVVCIVRAKDNESARDRVKDTLIKYSLTAGMEDEDSRVAVLAGDLSKPLLGLDANTFKEVASSIDSIIHCGAAVNLIKPYSALKAPNVLGTQEILRLGKFCFW